VLKKQLVRLLNALTDILHCLRTNLLPKRITFPQFGNMSLKFRTAQVLAPDAVVPLVKGNAMVIDNSTGVY
jgi:hypothetical protein